MEDKNKQIEQLISTIASGTQGITKEQIERAKQMYLNDDRDISEIRKELVDLSKKVTENYQKSVQRNEKKYNLNELINCRISNNTLHLHVVPPSVKEDMVRMGRRGFLDYANKELIDAVEKLPEILKENDEVETIFAVSPLLHNKLVQDMFLDQGFAVKKTTKEEFLNMFPGKKVGEAVVSKEDFLRRQQQLDSPTEQFEVVSSAEYLTPEEKIRQLKAIRQEVTTIKSNTNELSSMVNEETKNNTNELQKGREYVKSSPVNTNGFIRTKTIVIMLLVYIGLVISYLLYQNS